MHYRQDGTFETGEGGLKTLPGWYIEVIDRFVEKKEIAPLSD